MTDFSTDFIRARAEAAERERDALRDRLRWIPVEERLPEDNEYVLGAERHGCQCYTAWLYHHALRDLFVRKFSHWMPLPAKGSRRLHISSYLGEGQPSPKEARGMNKNISESENFVMLWVNGNKYLVGRQLADAVNKEREALRARAERAEADAERLAEVLRSFEWSYRSRLFGDVCPLCAKLPDEGHAADCSIGTAIAAHEAQKGGEG